MTDLDVLALLVLSGFATLLAAQLLCEMRVSTPDSCGNQEYRGDR